MIKNKKILITGGGGFIGSHLCQALVENNKITVYDNGRRDALQYTGLQNHKNLTFVKDDILNFENLKKSVKGQDIVLHLAAIAGVSSYYKHPLKTMEVNTIGAYNALKASAETGVKLFVNFSTSEVYGPFIFNAEEEGQTHQGPATVSRWSYSVSKLTTDHFSFAFFKEKKLPIISVRPFNIYGPGQIGEGAIQIFAKRAIDGEDLVVLGDGLQIRAWCYISDFVEGVLLCLENKNAIGHIFNIGNPAATVTILELAKKIKNMFDSKSKIVFQENKFTDVRVRVPSIETAKNILGFEPKVDLEEGLEKAIEWYRSVAV
ncbi:MAG: NAD-dependent epimerase/dehydratase family protein [Candidatus Omnitrophota bacterium]